MANWDEDSPLLQANLAAVLEEIVRAAPDRRLPLVEDALWLVVGVATGCL